MGNWRTIHIVGACKPDDARALQDWLSADYMDSRWGCLHGGGIFGLHNWAGEKIGAVGNLGERDFTVEDVATELTGIIKTVAPSLRVRIDCGDDHESREVVATILTDEDGTVEIKPPMVDTLPEVPDDVYVQRLYDAIYRG